MYDIYFSLSNFTLYNKIKKLWYKTMEYCSAIERNEFESIVVRKVILAMFFFFKISLAIWGPFVFLYKF